MSLLLALIFSLVLSLQSFALEITAANIVHLQNGRPANAGASIFPVIPFYPLFCIGVVWGLDKLYPHLGLYLLLFYFVLTFLWHFQKQSALNKEFKALQRKTQLRE